MKLLIHKNLHEVSVVDATRVVVEDSHGNPIALALEFGKDQILAVTADSPDFNRVLEELGIRKTVIVEDVYQTPLDQVHFG